MHGPQGDAPLVREIEVFSEELSRTIAAVLPGETRPFAVDVATKGPTTHFVVKQQPDQGIVLTARQVPLLRLVVLFRCSWDSREQHVAVQHSEIKVFCATGSQTPLFHYDYERGPHGSIPCAHLNIHAHRDEVVFGLMAAGGVGRGKRRSQTIQAGVVPSLACIHFPLGGHRFRPCLEDVLEMLICEFGLDRREGYQQALIAGRVRWRRKQLAAAVTDDAETAAFSLRSLGYEVIAPVEVPTPRPERTQAL